MNSKFSHRIVAIFVSVVMLFTMSPVLTFAGEYDAYEFVVSADKISVQSGDAVTLTVTVNGTMDNAYLLEFQIQYDPAEFNISPDIEEAFESTWYSEAVSGKGLGAIFQPSGGYKPDPAASSKNIYTVVYFDMMSPMFGRQPSFIGEDENDDLRGKDTAVAAKLVFTAQKDIEDISDCFIIKEAINGYGDKNGTIKDCEDTALVQLSETMAVQKVKNLIAAIGTPVTYSSKAAIEAARSAYDAITSDSLKAQVTNLAILTDAEAALKVRTDEMDRVKGLIAALDSTKDTFENDIKTAEAAFNALADDEKAALTDYAAKIQTAKDKLAQIKQEQADRAKAAEVDALIGLIGDVTLDSGEAIKSAEEALSALTPAQRVYVTKEDALTTARNTYDAMVANKNAAIAFEEAIAELPNPEDIDRTNIDEAERDYISVKNSYDVADEAIKSLVNPEMHEKFVAVGIEISAVKEAVAQAEAIETLIDGIGKLTLDSVEASEEKLTKIADKLAIASDRAKEYIKDDMMTAYEQACNTLAELKTKLKQIQDVIDAIDALGDADDITLDDEQAVLDAEEDYEALKALGLENRVENASTLFAIREKLNALIASEERVNNVIYLINQIGEVEFTSTSKAKIDSARSAYGRLTDAEKDKVDNYSILEAAEELYKELSDKAAQEEIDQNAAGAVKVLIDAIGTVELTPECEARIVAAEVAYKDLVNARQKELVGSHYDTLTQARDKYDALKKDQESIDAVIKAIEAIGTVTYDDECFKRIDDAQKAYDGLVRQELMDRVTNSEKLKAAKARYDELKAEDEAVNNVIVLINDIGEVSATEECLAKITAARNAYDSLERADLKNRVTNIEILLNAEKSYKKEILVINSKPVENYGADGKTMTVVTNVSEGMIVSCGAEKAAVVKIGEDIYHVFVTDHEISGSDIVLEEGTPAELMLGDIDGSGTIGANDARLVCGYIVRNEDALQRFDNLAFVKADVDGNGDINVLDAYVIAVAALNDPDRKVEFTILVDALLKLQ